MTADYELELKLLGDKDQLKGMLEIVGLYSNNGNKPAYFSSVYVNNKKIDLTNISDDVISDGSVIVTALGPYGGYGELNDVAIFRELAEAFPQGAFTAEISGNGQYEVQNLKCELKDGILNIETFFESNDEANDAWIEDVMKKLPLKKFKKLFKVEGEDFDEESYRYVFDSIGSEYSGDLSEVDFDDFVSYVEDNEGETELDEDEFAEIIENKLPEFDIVSYEEFSDDYEGGTTKQFAYDPVKKLYVGKKDSTYISFGEMINANEMIAKGLNNKGLPCDEQALANLSVNDAYAALVQGMESDEDDEEGIDLDDDGIVIVED